MQKRRVYYTTDRSTIFLCRGALINEYGFGNKIKQCDFYYEDSEEPAKLHATDFGFYMHNDQCVLLTNKAKKNPEFKNVTSTTVIDCCEILKLNSEILLPAETTFIVNFREGPHGLYSQYNLHPELVGSNAAGLMVFPDSSWKDVWTGFAEVTVKNEKERYVFVEGQMLQPDEAAFDDVLEYIKRMTWANGNTLIAMTTAPDGKLDYHIAHPVENNAWLHLNVYRGPKSKTTAFSADLHYIKRVFMDYKYRNLGYETDTEEKVLEGVTIVLPAWYIAMMNKGLLDLFMKNQLDTCDFLAQDGYSRPKFELSSPFELEFDYAPKDSSDMFVKALSLGVMSLYYEHTLDVYAVVVHRRQLHLLYDWNVDDIKSVMEEASALNVETNKAVRNGLKYDSIRLVSTTHSRSDAF